MSSSLLRILSTHKGTLIAIPMRERKIQNETINIVAGNKISRSATPMGSKKGAFTPSRIQEEFYHG